VTTDPLPSVSGVPSSERRAWTGVEERRLRDLYPRADAAALLAAFPGRTPGSVYARAFAMGLAGRRPPDVRRRRALPHKWAPHEDDAVLRAYARGGPGAVRKVCSDLGLTYRVVRRRATALGVRVTRIAPSPWTPREDEIIRGGSHLATAALRRRLATAGFRRTQQAVMDRRSGLGIGAEERAVAAEDRGVLTTGQVAAVFGVTAKTVIIWIEKGWLSARRPGLLAWEVGRKALREFVAGHAAHVDLRKVEVTGDKFLLLDILLDRKAA
jgi:hypothetical protein